MPMQVSLETWRRLHAACPKCGASGPSLKIEGISAALSGEAGPELGKAKVTCFGSKLVKPAIVPSGGASVDETEECDFQGTLEQLMPLPEDTRFANLLGALNLADNLQKSVNDTKLSPGALAAIVLAEEVITLHTILKMVPGQEKMASIRAYMQYAGIVEASGPEYPFEPPSRIVSL
jgi:hypothetical protein